MYKIILKLTEIYYNLIPYYFIIENQLQFLPVFFN